MELIVADLQSHSGHSLLWPSNVQHTESQLPQWSLRPRIYVDQQGSQNCLTVLSLIHFLFSLFMLDVLSCKKQNRREFARNISLRTIFANNRGVYLEHSGLLDSSWRDFATARKSLFREIASVTQLRRTDLGKMRQAKTCKCEQVCWPFADFPSLSPKLLPLCSVLKASSWSIVCQGGDHCMITLNVLRCLSPRIDYFAVSSGLNASKFRSKWQTENYQADEPEWKYLKYLAITL